MPGAVTIIPEPGNPGIEIEVINESVLTAIAIVTRPPSRILKYPDVKE